eukprot:5028862-Pleurochrysis_carterae.AAC.2
MNKACRWSPRNAAKQAQVTGRSSLQGKGRSPGRTGQTSAPRASIADQSRGRARTQSRTRQLRTGEDRARVCASIPQSRAPRALRGAVSETHSLRLQKQPTTQTTAKQIQAR